jgi:hypothetical protein
VATVSTISIGETSATFKPSIRWLRLSAARPPVMIQRPYHRAASGEGERGAAGQTAEDPTTTEVPRCGHTPGRPVDACWDGRYVVEKA